MASSAFDLDRIGGRRMLHALVDEVLACGENAMHLYRAGAASRVVSKPDKSPVTEADHAVERRLHEFFSRKFPGIGFLGEETGEATAGESTMRFIVDPIDGTRAFIRGIPSWSILVALEDAGEPVVGIALMPAAEQLFVGVLGDGATGNGRPLHLSAVRELGDAFVSHGGLAQFTDAGMQDMLVRLGRSTYTQRGFADFQGYRYLLEGRVDAMIDPSIKPWDLAPAAVLVREAGGVFTSLTGESTIYGGFALASNAALHPKLLALLQSNGA